MTNDETLEVAVFGSRRLLSVKSGRVQLGLSSIQSAIPVPIGFNATPKITDCDLVPDKLPGDARRRIEAPKYALADDFEQDSGPPEVLIRSDYFWQLITGSSMPICDGIFMIPTVLGLVLGGRYKSDESEKQAALVCLTEHNTHQSIISTLNSITTESRCSPPQSDVDEFWSLEKIGIYDSPSTDDDTTAPQQFNDTITFMDGRYQVCWPWKTNHMQLPTNYQLTLGRFRSLARRLSSCEKSIVEEYATVLACQEQLGIIERVPVAEMSNTESPVHYLSHHPVVNAGRTTTKLRVVYDATAKLSKHSASLNECLCRDPVILPDLCATLVRFRMNSVALVSDIEKAFLQLSLQRSQRDVTRFLWFKDPRSLDATAFVTYRFARVPFGVISSPFLLGATIRHHLEVTGTQIASNIRDNVYVDNVITGTDGEDDAINFYVEAKDIFQKAGMNLLEWCSSSETVMQTIPDADKCASRTVKMLGLKWNSEKDLLKLVTGKINPSPCTLRAKCFLRKLWIDQLEWDSKPNDDLRREWTRLHLGLAPIFDFNIQRKIEGNFDSDDVSLVAFSDASGEAYATAVYLRAPLFNSPNRYAVNLVYAKSRLAPISTETITIPRLELLGLTIAASAAMFVRESLKLSSQIKRFLLTDSMVVLGWLQSEKQLAVFIANRVKKLMKIDNVEFHHVLGIDNPADLATRGMSGEQIRNSSFWSHGPEWLRQNILHGSQLRDLIRSQPTNGTNPERQQLVTLSVFLLGRVLWIRRKISDTL